MTEKHIINDMVNSTEVLIFTFCLSLCWEGLIFPSVIIIDECSSLS
jgi:hypothetical protein